MHATPPAAAASTVAIDLAKDVFELAFANGARIDERPRRSRRAFARAFDNRAPLRIVMETCCAAPLGARVSAPRPGGQAARGGLTAPHVLTEHCQECRTISIMTKGSVPGWDKADNNSGSRSRLNDRPPPADFMMARAHRAHPEAVYTTATVPLPMIDDPQLRYLQGESIHELLCLLAVKDMKLPLPIAIVDIDRSEYFVRLRRD